MSRIGFIQGRLSPIVDGKIQAFPWHFWQQEFAIGAEHDWHVMEWTLDQDRLSESPLMTSQGQQEIKRLCAEYNFTIPSLTGDCFMQAPFYKMKGIEREQLMDDFRRIIDASAEIGVEMIVVPLVDNGSLETTEQEEALLEGLADVDAQLRDTNQKIVFESDFAPEELTAFIQKLDKTTYGINYDIGNSAALGFDFRQELSTYSDRIINVHVKDRVLGGTTVPLGEGAADLAGVLQLLKENGYTGNYILQTARATDDDHVAAINCYRKQVCNWLDERL